MSIFSLRLFVSKFSSADEDEALALLVFILFSGPAEVTEVAVTVVMEAEEDLSLDGTVGVAILTPPEPTCNPGEEFRLARTAGWLACCPAGPPALLSSGVLSADLLFLALTGVTLFLVLALLALAVTAEAVVAVWADVAADVCLVGVCCRADGGREAGVAAAAAAWAAAAGVSWRPDRRDTSCSSELLETNTVEFEAGCKFVMADVVVTA